MLVVDDDEMVRRTTTATLWQLGYSVAATGGGRTALDLVAARPERFAVVLLDARKGVIEQTRRHACIAAMLGIPHIVFAVNKMDLVDFDESVFDRIRSEYIAFTANLGIEDLQFIPISALRGDNVVEKSDEMPWYQGSTLMYLLENVQIASDRNFEDFRFAVQRVSRPDSSFRGYSGTVQSGIGERVGEYDGKADARAYRVEVHTGSEPKTVKLGSTTLQRVDDATALDGGAGWAWLPDATGIGRPGVVRTRRPGRRGDHLDDRSRAWGDPVALPVAGLATRRRRGGPRPSVRGDLARGFRGGGCVGRRREPPAPLRSGMARRLLPR